MTDRRRANRRQRNEPVEVERRQGERRRGDRRQNARAPLDLWVEEEKGNELYFRRTGNISPGGIYFEQTIPHSLGTRVKIRFSLPGNADVIEAEGEIVNTPEVKDGLGMGLEFRDLDAATQKRIQKWVDENADAD